MFLAKLYGCLRNPSPYVTVHVHFIIAIGAFKVVKTPSPSA